MNLQFIYLSSMISVESDEFPVPKARLKGGEKMSLEGIKQVTEAEEMTQRRKAEAAAQAKKTVSDAQRAGQAALAAARAEAQAKAAQFMKEAEEKASKQAESVVEETKRSCDALRKAAGSRMAEASALIVRRVVNV